MNAKTKTALKWIFHEAQVIDFDFSKWDRYIRLVVIAWTGITDNEPIHNIDFLDVESLNWKSQHLDALPDSENRHCQWHYIQVRIKPERHGYHVVLHSTGPGPDIEILCGDVKVSKISRRIVEKVYPKWGGAYQPLARPDFIHLSRRLQARQLNKRVKKNAKKGPR